MYLSGIEVADTSLLLLFHSGPQPVDWLLPGQPWAAAYDVVHDTSGTLTGRLPAAAASRLAERCVVVLRVVEAADAAPSTAQAGTSTGSGQLTSPSSDGDASSSLRGSTRTE
jgi:glycogen operon protein